MSNRALSEGHNKCTMNLGDVRKSLRDTYCFLTVGAGGFTQATMKKALSTYDAYSRAPPLPSMET